MKLIVSFDRLTVINEYIFRNEVWKTFGNAIMKRQDLVMDFRNVEFIVSTVVTKLCCFGEIAKKVGIDLKIIPSIKLANYLAEMDFWNIAHENNIFSFDEKYLYYFSLNKKVTNALFCLEKDTLKHKYDKTFEFADWVSERTKYKIWIKAELIGIRNTIDKGNYTVENIPDRCKAVLKTISNFVGYSEYTSEDRILSPIIELVHNAVWHSQGKCYFFVQTSKYNGDFERIGIDISVADTGRGLYKSLVDKDDDNDKDIQMYYNKDNLVRITNKSEQSYCSILDALFYREQSGTRGLYDIITDLAKEPREYLCEVHLINGNIKLDLTEGQKRSKDGEIYETYGISNFINYDIKEIINNKHKYFVPISDIGFSFCVDIGITIPL